MDYYRFTDASYKNNLLDLFRTKYADKKIDLILVNGYHALTFAAAHGEEIFPQTPVVFATVMERQVKRLKLKQWFTGCLLKIDYLGLLDTALNLFDSRQLKRWGIDERELPEGSIVRYKE